MTCLSCAERGKLIVQARAAYRRGDMPEAKWLLKQALGTVMTDVNKFVFRRPDGTTEYLDFTTNKPESTP